MTLTGIPLILIIGVLAVLATFATVRFWRVAGRWRLPVRSTGLVLVQSLVVLTVALIANRADNFYPSWQALTGDIGAVPQAAPPPPPGRLDERLATARTGLPWSPPGNEAWRLAGPPTLIPPAGYARDADRAFPVIVAIVTGDRAAAIRARAAAAPDVLTLVVTPTPATVAADLAKLPEQLEHDVRAAGLGWAIVADPSFVKLAENWLAAAPGQFHTVTRIDPRHPAAAIDSAVRQLPAPLNPPLRLPS